jgi:phosphoribosylformylglycinamidine (FGAM) synthase-like amidotransferase family enzyme
MPHPERCSEELLGGTDGRRVLEALTASRHTGMVSASVQ